MMTTRFISLLLFSGFALFAVTGHADDNRMLSVIQDLPEPAVPAEQQQTHPTQAQQPNQKADNADTRPASNLYHQQLRSASKLYGTGRETDSAGDKEKHVGEDPREKKRIELLERISRLETERRIARDNNCPIRVQKNLREEVLRLKKQLDDIDKQPPASAEPKPNDQ